MFIRKLIFGQKIGWVLIDLLVVIIGVYCAFLIQTSAEKKSNLKEKEKVLTALKVELETFRIQFPQFANYVADFYNEIKDEEYVDFSDWRFADPQYAYKIIEYAMDVNNNEIVDFQLFEQLQKMYVGIKQLEFTERNITKKADLYKQLIPELSETHPLNLERKADNRTSFKRFKLFLRGRIQGLRRATTTAENALELINESLGPEKCKPIEKDVIIFSMKYTKSEEEAIEMIQSLFPNFSVQELKEFYKIASEKE